MYALIFGEFMDICCKAYDPKDLERLYNSFKADNTPCEIINCDNASHLSVTYTEVGGPWGYGHQEVSYETYGGIVTILKRFVNWVKDTERAFGPDWRDVYDYFRHCSILINGEDKTDWFRKNYVSKLNKDIYFA